MNHPEDEEAIAETSAGLIMLFIIACGISAIIGQVWAWYEISKPY